MKKISRPTAILLGFMLVNLIWRLIFLPASQSAYTDGILQVDMFGQGVSYWPPLYALLARLFAWIPGVGLEGAGRLVSIACGVLILWPLHDATRRLYGLRAAFWAMAAWTVTPLALQWSLQVMTDMPFAFFWMASLAALLAAVESYLPGLFPQAAEGGAPLAQPRQGSQWLAIASLCGALGTLTRYQGILLLAPIGVAVWELWKLSRTIPGKRGMSPWLTLLPWLAVPLWLGQGASSIMRHSQQITERTGGSLGVALVSYWHLFEDFLMNSPYFVGFGVFGFLLYGLFRTQWATARLRWAGWVCLYLWLAVFAMQSVFSSYQARYLLPLVPLACLFAGHGLATWERHAAGKPLRFWGLAAPALAYGLAFSALVAAYQGSPFKELKQAAEYVRGLNLPEGRRVFSNEVYNGEQGLFAIKAAFWSGRKVLPWGSEPTRPGDLLILSSAYAGGQANYLTMRDGLINQMNARPLKRFNRAALPLITDIMQEPGTAQNPLAMGLRYQPQHYEAMVLEVGGPAAPAATATAAAATAAGSEPIKPIPPQKAELPEAKRKEIEAIREELKGMK